MDARVKQRFADIIKAAMRYDIWPEGHVYRKPPVWLTPEQAVARDGGIERASLVFTLGLPGSGKSTWAEKFVLSLPAGMAIRVNRDSLRLMMHAGRWDGNKTEKHITAARDALIVQFLAAGKTVVCDDTNFHPDNFATYMRMASEAGVNLVLVDFTDVPIKECIKRDLKRMASVGEKVIRGMHARYLEIQPEPYAFDPDLPWAILVDIDGTLAHMAGRSPFEWHRVGEDTVDDVVRDLTRDAADWGYRVIVMSGRDSVCREETEAWLTEHKVPYDELLMRPEGDMRKDSVIKAELFDNHIRGSFNVRYVLDDRNQVVEMWRGLGLKVLQVAEGAF